MNIFDLIYSGNSVSQSIKLQFLCPGANCARVQPIGGTFAPTAPSCTHPLPAHFLPQVKDFIKI